MQQIYSITERSQIQAILNEERHRMTCKTVIASSFCLFKAVFFLLF